MPARIRESALEGQMRTPDPFISQSRTSILDLFKNDQSVHNTARWEQQMNVFQQSAEGHDAIRLCIIEFLHQTAWRIPFSFFLN